MRVETAGLPPVRPSPPGSIRVFDSPDAPADPAALSWMASSLSDADLAAPPVVLPDFHLKDDKEMPSSIAVATTETIRPTLSSASLNCGMALIALDVDRPRRKRITDFFTRVRERYPYPPTYRRDLTPDEVLRCASEGGRFAVDKFDLDPSVLEAVEEAGCLDVERFGGAERIRRELPWSVKQLSRIRFGTIGPSNHFIELQEVEEVLDPETASLFGLREGQVTLQYHGGGGSLPGELGLLFGSRKRYPTPVRLQMAIQKPLYHLGRARSVAEFRRRRSLYFSGGCPPVERSGAEGERISLVNTMAMNYGFAFRLTAFAFLSSLARRSLGARTCRLVVDSPHNSIYEEEVGGELAVVHRHNACRALPASLLPEHPVFSVTGAPLLLPGTARTSSYLCAADEGAERSLYSTCHGAGTIVETFMDNGRSGPDPIDRSTLRFSYDTTSPVDTPHVDDRGVDEALTILTSNRIVRPVARLRPFAVLT